MRVAALVLAAGRGERLRQSLASSDEPPAKFPPKAWVELQGRSLLARSLEALAQVPEIEALVPVLAPDEPEFGLEEAGVPKDLRGLLPPVPGGAERQDSVLAGLRALPEDMTHVAVHDAARPLVRPEDVSRVVREALNHGAALLAAPVADTVHRGREEILRETLDRSELWAAQTPQVFAVTVLRQAIERAMAEGWVGTDDAGLVARLGGEVRIVPGDPNNRKITTAADLAWAAGYLESEGDPIALRPRTGEAS